MRMGPIKSDVLSDILMLAPVSKMRLMHVDKKSSQSRLVWIDSRSVRPVADMAWGSNDGKVCAGVGGGRLGCVMKRGA